MVYDPRRHHRRSTRLKGYDYAKPGAYYVTICAAQRGLLFGRGAHGVIELNAIGQVIHDVWLSLPRHYPHIALDAFVVMPDHVHGIIVIVDPPPPPHGAIHDAGGVGGVDGVDGVDGGGGVDGVDGVDGGGGVDGVDGVGTQRAASLRTSANNPTGATADDGRTPANNPTGATADDARDAGRPPANNPTGATRDAGRATSACTHGGAEIPPIPPGSLPVIVRAFKSAATRQVNILRQTPGAILWQERYHDHIVRDADDLDRIRNYIANNPIFWRNPYANTRRDDPLR